MRLSPEFLKLMRRELREELSRLPQPRPWWSIWLIGIAASVAGSAILQYPFGY